MNALPKPLDEKYEAVSLLGEGGMGRVYLVRHRHLDTKRVIKTVRGALSSDADIRERFLREARLAARLAHPNLTAVHDFGIDAEGDGYLELEYLEGLDLRRVIREGAFRSQPVSLFARLALQVLAGLEHIHRNGIVHRDVSPDNIFLTMDGEGAPLAKILDLGIAKDLQQDREESLTATGAFVGKIDYSSPESLSGGHVGPASDLYSLSATLYELLTGTKPFDAASLPARIYAQLHEPPRAFEETDPAGFVTPPLRAVVLRGLEKPPEKRYPSAAAMAAALTEAMSEVPDFSVEDFGAEFLTRVFAGAGAAKPPMRGVEKGPTTLQMPAPASADTTLLPAPATRVERAAPAVEPTGLPRLSRYKLVEPLGRGSIGTVYRAWDEVDGTMVALKVLTGGARPSEEERHRFLRSGRLWRHLDHPNVVRVLGLEPGADGVPPHIAMELLEGDELSKHLRRHADLPPDMKLSVAIQVARGLEYLHARGVVHRDIRTGTIFITRKDGAKILESGIARRSEDSLTRVTALGERLGATAYQAPELLGQEADCRSDIYAFGVVLLCLFSGGLAPEGATSRKRLALVDALPVPEAIRAAVRRCLAEDPADRPASMGAVCVALEDAAGLARSRDAEARPRVIFMLHGIRTYAQWQRSFSEVAAAEGWLCRTSRWNFGWFSALRLLLPWERQAMVEWFRRTYDEERYDREISWAPGQLPSIVAHSFGTYILGNALLAYEYLRFDRVLLCGSILPPDFPWETILARGQVRAVRNEFGTRDFWTGAVRFVVPRRTGPSGSSGFALEHPRLEQERFLFSHSEYFEKAHMRDKWVRFLGRAM